MSSPGPVGVLGSALPRPLMVIRPRGRWPGLGLGEAWRFRGLAVTFASRELRVRYRQTALGVTWFVLQPIIVAGTLAFLFGAVARMPPEGAPRLVFTLAGVLGWNLFSGIVTRGSQILVANAQLISKVYFPRELLPMSVALTALVDLAVALPLFAVVAAVNGLAWSWAILTLPLWVLLAGLLATGLALFASAVAVWYRDLLLVVQLLLQILLYLSPLAYSLSSVPERYRTFVSINPLTPILEGFRWCLLGGSGLSPLGAVHGAVVAVGFFLAGLLAFRRLERSFADVV